MRHLPVPGLDLRLAFGRIRSDVIAATATRQQPFVHGELGEELVSLVQAAAEPPPAAPSDVARDFVFVRQINSRAAWKIFIDTHRHGPHVDHAREELDNWTPSRDRASPRPR
jgi:hypothetical protein